jgi:hypothetical protein
MHPHWTAHNLRGMISSKAVNLGFPIDATCLRARVSKEVFMTHYFKFVLYSEKSIENESLTFEQVTRIKTTVLSYFAGRYSTQGIGHRFLRSLTNTLALVG